MFKISIIIPVFNIGDKLKKAFDSILNQTLGFENLEVIFVDDCSTDDSQKIIKEFADSYDNVRSIFLEENSGFAGKPRNVGISNATADYIMFLDPDDYYLENACEILYNEIIGASLDLVSGNFITDSVKGEYKINWYNINLTNGFIQIDSIYQQPNLFLLPPSVWSKIFRKEFILNNNIMFPVGIPAQDLVFVYHSLLKSTGIKYIDTPVVRYISGDEESENKSVTSTRNRKNVIGLLKAYYHTLDLFENHENLKEYVTIHLNFWVKQLVISKMAIGEKVNMLRYAYPMFEIFKESDNLYIRNGFEPLFHKVYEKDFIGAANLSNLAAIGLEENYYNIYDEIKSRNILVVFDDYDRIFKKSNLINLFQREGYSIQLIFIDLLFNHADFNLNEDENLVIYNLFNYYSNKFNLNNQINHKTINSHENGFLVKKEKLRNGSLLLKYFDDKYDDKELVKEEFIFKDYSVVKEYENGICIQEEYYTCDGFNFLEISSDIKLKDRFDELYMLFNFKEELYTHFIEEICLKMDKKPFLLNLINFELEKISSEIAFTVNGFNFDLSNINQIKTAFRDAYINESKISYNLPLENEKLKKQNKKLKANLKSSKKYNKKLKKESVNYKNLYDKVISSKSWKITKPLRWFSNLFK